MCDITNEIITSEIYSIDVKTIKQLNTIKKLRNHKYFPWKKPEILQLKTKLKKS